VLKESEKKGGEIMKLRSLVGKKSVLIPALLVVALLIGGGVAYAFTVNNMTDTTLWAGEASITDAVNLSVDEATNPPGYRLVMDAAMANVTAVEVDVDNAGAAAQAGSVEVRIFNGAGVSQSSGVNNAQSPYPVGGPTTETVTLGAAVPCANVATIHIIVNEV
jgi:hypothetical protein